jgi:hypothetical protein
MKLWTRFDLWVQHYFDAWVEAKVRDSVSFLLPSNSDLMCEFIRRMDIQPLAELVAGNDDLTRAVVSELEDGIDTDDIAEKVAGKIDASDVASYMDASDVASNMDIEISEIAERVVQDLDMSELAAELDYDQLKGEMDYEQLAEDLDYDKLAEELEYDKLAEVLVSKLKEAWTH